MRTFWIGSALVLAGAAVLAGCGKKDANVLTLGTDAQSPPFALRAEAGGPDVVGFDVDLARAIAAAAGKKLKIAEMDFARLLPALADGKVDLAMAAWPLAGADRDQADFSEPYYDATPAAIILAGGPVPETKEELKGLRTAAVAGTPAYAAAEELAPAAPLRAVATPLAAVVDLMNSQVDLAVIDEQPAALLAERHPELMLLRPGFAPAGYAVAVRKGDTNLLAAVNRTVAELKADGRYKQLLERWVIGQPEWPE
jgi:polar amino acid transport system substrate-binding protein